MIGGMGFGLRGKAGGPSLAELAVEYVGTKDARSRIPSSGIASLSR